uniref:Ig-like domain-containing protein n=1 Tax=Astyanax mexicanus TaxID=7994 RepID=A0A3B1J9R0_ASTMX
MFKSFFKSTQTKTHPLQSSVLNIYFIYTEKPTPVVNITPANQVFRGESVTLSCELQGGVGEIEGPYIWNKNGNTVSPSSTEQQLIIQSVEYSDRGEYSCSGTVKGIGRDSNTSAAVTLTVFEKPTAVLNIKPGNRVFRGETVTIRCDLQGGGDFEWTYNWSQNSVSSSSTSNQYTISSVTDSHWGDYYCYGAVKGTTRYSHYSAAVRLTVSETPKPELTSPLKGAALIGNPVTLYCNLKQSAGWRFYWFKHTQTPESETTTETHSSYTIRPVNVSDGGQYWCRAGRGDPVYYTHYSDALWVNVTASSSPVSLIVSPSRSQHFPLDPLSLICEGQSSSTGWRVRRYSLSESKVSDCSSGWGSVTGSTCNISYLIPTDTGVYWCESESGGGSNPVNITVHSKSSTA